MTDRHANPEDPDLYALGALDGEDKLAYEAHVRSCAACARELDAARQRVALLGLAAPPLPPPPGLKDALLRRARAERPAAGARPAPVMTSGFGWLTPALGVGFAVFAVLSVVLWMRNTDDQHQIATLQTELAEAQAQTQQIAATRADFERMIGSPETLHVALAAQPGQPQGAAGILYDRQTGNIACAGHLPEAPADKSYQLWLVPASGAPISLGVMSQLDPQTPMTVRVTPGTVAKAFAFTLEPKGGRPGPTGPKVLVGAVG